MMYRIGTVSLAVLVGLAPLSLASPVVIDEATFKQNGGNVANLANSIKTDNEKLRQQSLELPWLVVGNIGGCTATWLGDKESWSYILTAAHCVDYVGTATAIEEKFSAPNGQVIASGRGTVYVPPQRINIPPGMGGASTDIAILKLPTRNAMVDGQGRPLDRPILNDASDEKGRDIIYVGYGTWGVGKSESGSYGPAKGERRLYGRSRIDRLFELDHGIGAPYQSEGPSPYWATTAPGDSGSAWWQIRGGRPVIIATTNGGHATLSTGARVSKYVGWVKSIYPEARFLSAQQPQGCIVSMDSGARYCMTAGQKAAYSLPAWINGHNVSVDAAPGTAVKLSDFDALSYNRVASFVGTVGTDGLRKVRAANGQDLDFSRPKSMGVTADKTPLGCIVSLTSCARYCLPAGQGSGYSLPSWVKAHEVQVEAASGTAVVLSDFENLAYNRLATFDGFVQNWELKKVKAENGQDLDFSRPKSMRVVKK
ncbi:peptidase S1 and S6, chymotrypsin/Hap [Metarhizium rileyi]|uniref:Peptidase S1 and S6, chymotrypsin/Hap n=1 Tax=Metarhizium rileyi (strain RCEF 4871) TaxID=1649241 RepID=A0A166WM82_METRR|nr:peptidase S1 and S6, chymotrypsin/Hap [Metarhizium rileyi RCEF 4871]